MKSLADKNVEKYITCLKCGVMRNTEIAENCPLCFKKTYNTLELTKRYEVINRLAGHRDYLAEDIKKTKKMIEELDKNEAVEIMKELKRLVIKAGFIIKKFGGHGD